MDLEVVETYIYSTCIIENGRGGLLYSQLGQLPVDDNELRGVLGMPKDVWTPQVIMLHKSPSQAQQHLHHQNQHVSYDSVPW